MSPLGVFVVVALLVSSKQVIGNEFLPPPRNVTVVSKDFSLFLTWLPDEHYPPGVSYTVQWKNSFVPWDDISHCRDISETICNITCVSPKLHNKYWVRVKAQMRTGTGIVSSIWRWKSVDYEVHVDIVPPVLQLRKTEHILRVNATFVYPSCTKAIFQQGLTYDLKIWAERGTEKPREFKELTKNVMDINITDWTGGNYCVCAQAFFNNNKKWSNVSEPICTLLHENSTALQGGAQSWGFVAFPFLIMLSAGAIAFFLWSKYKMKDIKMPQALDFSRFRSTKKLLEFGGRESITVYTLTCTEVPFVSEMWGRPGLHLYSTWAPSVHSLSEEDDEDDKDDDDSLIPYTGMLKFQKKERNGQRIAMDQKVPDSSSGSENSEPNGGCFLPDAMISERLFASTECETGVDDTSGSSENNRMSLSENLSADSSLGFPIIGPTSRTEGQEGANGDIDFSLQWPLVTKEPEFDFLTGLQFGDANSHPELTCKRLDDAQVTLGEINLDSFDLLHEEQLTEKESSEKDSSDCERLFVEMPLLKVPSCKEDLENNLLGGNRSAAAEVLSGSRFHGYQPKHIPYISRT